MVEKYAQNGLFMVKKYAYGSKYCFEIHRCWRENIDIALYGNVALICCIRRKHMLKLSKKIRKLISK